MLLMNGQDLSPSLRGRGLKFYFSCFLINIIIVALFTRAWIEISHLTGVLKSNVVALFTRAWIEIQSQVTDFVTQVVALFTRAWIEIAFMPV